MAALRDPKHEIVAQELAAGKAADEASRIAGYPAGSSFAANARKRAQRADIRSRVMEIQGPAAERAGLTTEYMLARLFNLSLFNLDDYLAPANEEGERFFDISQAPRSVLGRLSELQIEHTTDRRTGEDKKTLRTFVRTKLKGHDPIAIFTLGARLQGLLRDRTEITGKDGDPLLPILTDAERAKALAALITKTNARQTAAKPAT